MRTGDFSNYFSLICRLFDCDNNQPAQLRLSGGLGKIRKDSERSERTRKRLGKVRKGLGKRSEEQGGLGRGEREGSPSPLSSIPPLPPSPSKSSPRPFRAPSRAVATQATYLRIYTLALIYVCCFCAVAGIMKMHSFVFYSSYCQRSYENTSRRSSYFVASHNAMFELLNSLNKLFLRRKYFLDI